MGHTVDGWVVGDDGESTLEDGTYSIGHSVDGSEIPRPTTWEVYKTLLTMV